MKLLGERLSLLPGLVHTVVSVFASAVHFLTVAQTRPIGGWKEGAGLEACCKPTHSAVEGSNSGEVVVVWGVRGVVQLGRDPDSTGRPSKQPLTVDCRSVAQVQALGSDRGVFFFSPLSPFRVLSAMPGSLVLCLLLLPLLGRQRVPSPTLVWGFLSSQPPHPPPMVVCSPLLMLPPLLLLSLCQDHGLV